MCSLTKIFKAIFGPFLAKRFFVAVIGAGLMLLASPAFAQRTPSGDRDGQLEIPPECQTQNGEIVCAQLPPNSTNVLFSQFGICVWFDNTSSNTYFIPFRPNDLNSFLLSVARLSVPGVTADPCCPTRELPITASTGSVFNITLPIGRDRPGTATGQFLNRAHTFQLSRQDCNTSTPQQCNTTSWTETYNGTASCDARSWNWSAGPSTTDTVPPLNPPPNTFANCTNGQHGTTYFVATGSGSRFPTVQECPFGAGTRLYNFTIETQFSCNNGTQTPTGTTRNVNETPAGQCATQPQNGDCGAANGVVRTTAPSSLTDLCDIGTPTSVLGNATSGFVWTCTSPNGGSNAVCQTLVPCVTENFSGAGTDTDFAYSINDPSRYDVNVTYNGSTMTASIRDQLTNIVTVSPVATSLLGNNTLVGYYYSPQLEFVTSVAPTAPQSQGATNAGVSWFGRASQNGNACLFPSTGGNDANCGAAQGQTFANPPASNLCNNGQATPLISNSSGWTWYCLDNNSASGSICSANRTQTQAEPQCGSAAGVASGTAPTTGLCQTGTASTVLTNNLSWLWSCSVGNSSTQCTAPRSNPPQTGSCGNAAGVFTVNAPTSGLCSIGTATAVSGTCGGGYSWTCNGVNGGNNVVCTTPAGSTGGNGGNGGGNQCPTNGTCGSANGVFTTTAPTSGLCTVGTASAVAGTCGSGFTWTCSGGNGGDIVNCSTPNGTAGGESSGTIDVTASDGQTGGSTLFPGGVMLDFSNAFAGGHGGGYGVNPGISYGWGYGNGNYGYGYGGCPTGRYCEWISGQCGNSFNGVNNACVGTQSNQAVSMSFSLGQLPTTLNSLTIRFAVRNGIATPDFSNTLVVTDPSRDASRTVVQKNPNGSQKKSYSYTAYYHAASRTVTLTGDADGWGDCGGSYRTGTCVGWVFPKISVTYAGSGGTGNVCPGTVNPTPTVNYAWSGWGACTAECGGGIQSRSCNGSDGSTNNNPALCGGGDTQQFCNQQSCAPVVDPPYTGGGYDGDYYNDCYGNYYNYYDLLGGNGWRYHEYYHCR